MSNLGNLLSGGKEKADDAEKQPDLVAPTENEEAETNREAVLIATSAPIQRFKIGRFQFERGVLNLYNSDDVAEFRGIVEKLPPADRRLIRIIDKEAAESMVRPPEPGATKQFDSSVGRQRETLATGDKVIGERPLEGAGPEEFAKLPQTDNNKPVDVKN